VTRQKARASKAVMAQSKAKQLEKMGEMDDLEEEANLHFSFNYKKTPAKIVLDAQNIGFGYDPARPLFQNLSFKLEKGKCLAIIGKNGKGKSTLLNVLAGEEPGNTQIVVFRLFCIGNRTRIGTFIRTLSDSVPKIDGRKDHDAYDRINDDAPHEASRRAIFSGCGQKRYNHQNDVEISQSFEKHFQLGFVHGRFILNSLFGLASEIIAMAFYIGPNLGHWILK
jgi:ATPase subunit of ABC transporter with duplicated ATPase domains